MSQKQHHAAAISDIDAQPITPDNEKRMKRTPQVKVIRRALGLSQEEFAMRFQIPLGTLRDWEQNRKEPGATARAYLLAIARNPEATSQRDTTIRWNSEAQCLPKVTSHTDEDAKNAVKRFCDQVFWLRIVRRMYKELFEMEDSLPLMKKTAWSFFEELNTILQNYLLLEMAKVTDPPKSGTKENLTVANLVLSIDWPPGVREKLGSLNEVTKGFRDHILEARNKLLAHLDKEAFLSRKPLGQFPEGEDEVFLKTLEEICNVAHEACFGQIFGQMVLTEPGDVINFKRTLVNAAAFDQLLADSKGIEKKRLFSYLKKARGS
jgi:putative transcriptional regulator